MRLLKRVGDERTLTLGWLTAWAIAVGFGAVRNTAGVTAFAGAGTVMVLARAFYRRMQGPTTLGPQGVETGIAPVSVTGPAGPETSEAPELDPSKLVAKWPTLADALRAIPTTWTKERVRHEDGQEYLHVRSPQAGYDLVVHVAALDSAAPRWLMVAISVMESG